MPTKVMVDQTATARDLIAEFDPRNLRHLAQRLESIEELLSGLSHRRRLMLLNALLRDELNAVQAE